MLLVGGSKPDGFVELDNPLMVDWLNGSEEVGDVRLIGDILGEPLWEDKGGGFDCLVKCDDPVAMGFNCFGDFGQFDGELKQFPEVMALLGLNFGGISRPEDL